MGNDGGNMKSIKEVNGGRYDYISLYVCVKFSKAKNTLK